MHVLEIIHCYWMVFKYQVCILSNNKYTLQAQNHVGYIALMLMFVYRSLDSSVGRAGDCSWSNQSRYLQVTGSNPVRGNILPADHLYCHSSQVEPEYYYPYEKDIKLLPVYIVFSFLYDCKLQRFINTYLYIP